MIYELCGGVFLNVFVLADASIICGCVSISVCSTQMAAGPKSGSSLLLQVGVPHLLCSMLLVLLMLNPR
jgi:hypothetical protein